MEKSHISTHDKEVLNRLFNPNLPYGDVVDEDDPLIPKEEEIESDAVKQVKHIETEGVRAAESGDIQKSLDLFSQAINLIPERASGYNNRAQSLRLKGDVEGALEDLNKAIQLSNGQGKVACQAYTQRGLILKLEEREEESLEDFKCAAKLGGQFAKQQVIAMNPYAALCNQMLAEVIHKVKTGEM